MRSKKSNIVSVTIPEFKNLESGQIVKWNFQKGDVVKDKDIICEIEYYHLPAKPYVKSKKTS